MDKTLVLQSLKAAYSFLDGAEKALDLKHGEGHAAAHPDLVGYLMLTAALDFHARAHAEVMSEIADKIDLISCAP